MYTRADRIIIIIIIITIGTLLLRRGVRTNDCYNKWSSARGVKNMVRDEQDFEYFDHSLYYYNSASRARNRFKWNTDKYRRSTARDPNKT